MRCPSIIAILLAFTAAASETSARADWMFRRAYASRSETDPQPPLPIPRQGAAYRRAIPQRGPGFAVRDAYRYNIYRIRSGLGTDTTIMREFRFDATP